MLPPSCECQCVPSTEEARMVPPCLLTLALALAAPVLGQNIRNTAQLQTQVLAADRHIYTYSFVKEFRNFELNRGVLVLVCILLLLLSENK